MIVTHLITHHFFQYNIPKLQDQNQFHPTTNKFKFF
jgi:hypothetical protein